MINLRVSQLRQLRIFLCLNLLLVGNLLIPAECHAQIVVSAGVQELYDSNIFLEDNNADLSNTNLPPQAVNKYVDGKLNDDFITNTYVETSSAPRMSRYFSSAIDARLGGMFFGSESSEDRITLDSLVKLESEEVLIRRPWSVSVTSAFNSGATSLGTAEGSAARRGQSHTATLNIDSGERMVLEKTTFAAGYSLVRYDFLGEFLTQSSDSQRDNFFKLRGSDYFDNRIHTKFTNVANSDTEFFLTNDADYMTFTSGDSDTSSVESSSDLDRINYTPSVGARYIPMHDLVLSGQVGMDLSYYTNTPPMRSVSSVNADGTVTTELKTPSDTETSLFWGTDLTYLLTQSTTLGLTAMQSAGTDIDGNRVLVRTLALNLSQLFADTLVGTLGGRYSQFNNNNSLNNATDRFEALASLRYALTDTVALQFGYSYVKQNADFTNNSTVLYGNGDYESHRAYVSLDTGFVGLPK